MTRASYEIHRDRNDAIIAMWNANQTAAVIADKLDITTGDVHQVVYRRRKRGEKLRNGNAPVMKERDMVIAKMVESGKRNADIAREIGVTHSTIAGVVYRLYTANGKRRPEPYL